MTCLPVRTSLRQRCNMHEWISSSPRAGGSRSSAALTDQHRCRGCSNDCGASQRGQRHLRGTPPRSGTIRISLANYWPRIWIPLLMRPVGSPKSSTGLSTGSCRPSICALGNGCWTLAAARASTLNDLPCAASGLLVWTCRVRRWRMLGGKLANLSCALPTGDVTIGRGQNATVTTPAAMIYYDLGVLSDADRGDVLTRIYTALRSGGRFAFGLRTPAWRVPAEPSPTWCLGGPGFWRGSPYLELTRHFSYTQPQAHLRQTAIIEPNGQVSVYRFWDRLYTVGVITAALEASGFQVEDLRSDPCGTLYSEESEAFGVLARKR